MIGSMSSVSLAISSIYDSNNQTLANLMKQVASGKRINQPSDDFAGYIQAQSLGNSITDLGTVKQNLTQAKAGAQVAQNAANQMLSYANQMKTIAANYGSATLDQKTLYDAQFAALKTSIQQVRDTTMYNGSKVFDPTADTTIATVNLAVDGSTNNFTMGFNHTNDVISDADLTAAVAGTSSTIDALLTKTTSAATKATDFLSTTDMFSANVDSMVSSYSQTQSLITNIDDAQVSAEVTDLQVRQQAAIAMLAQANVSRNAIATLYGAK